MKYVDDYLEIYPWMRNVSQEIMLEGFYYFVFKGNNGSSFVNEFCKQYNRGKSLTTKEQEQRKRIAYLLSQFTLKFSKNLEDLRKLNEKDIDVTHPDRIRTAMEGLNLFNQIVDDVHSEAINFIKK